jgi:hypothetical protein
MLENAVYNILRNDSGVSAYVTDPRGIAFTLLPTGVRLPAVVIHNVVGLPTTTLDATTDLNERRMQFDCYGSNYTDARALSAAVKNALVDLAIGTYSNGDSPETTMLIQTSIVNNDFDMPFEQGGTGQGFIYRAVLDITFWFNEGVFPTATPSNVSPDIDGGTFEDSF